MRHPLRWFLLSDEPRRCIHGTTIDCLGCRSSLLEYRLVAVEVVGLLSAFAVFGCPVVDLRQGVVAVGIGVDIGIPAVPNESGFLFEVV